MAYLFDKPLYVRGGIASGMAVNDYADKKRKEQGLAAGLQEYLGASDEGQKDEALKNIAQYSPETAMDIYNSNRMTPYQEEMIGLAKQRLANSGSLTPYQSAMLELKQRELDQKGGTSNNPFEKSVVNNIAKKYSDNVAAAQSTYDEYANADRILDKIDTGAQYLVPGSDKVAAAFNPDVAEFIAAQNKLVPTMRPKGSGSTSDKDMEIFKSATFGITKPKEANRNIIRGRMAAAENERDFEQLRAEWLSGGGSLTDFDKAWREYLNANPIFASKDGKLNSNRKSAYDWFSGANEQPAEEENQSGFGVGETQTFNNGFTVTRVK